MIDGGKTEVLGDKYPAVSLRLPKIQKGLAETEPGLSRWEYVIQSSDLFSCLKKICVILPGGKGRPARKADKLTAICEPTV
jgi:hypothetical protein